MSAPATPSKQGGDQLEVRFLAAMMRHMKQKPDIDWDGLAAELGLSNAKCAATRFSQIKKKLGISFDKTYALDNSKITKRTATQALNSKVKRTKKVEAPVHGEDAEMDLPNSPTPAGTGFVKHDMNNHGDV